MLYEIERAVSPEAKASASTPATPAAGDADEMFPTGPNGRLETVAQYEHRLAINAKMRFHRSLTSTLYVHIETESGIAYRTYFMLQQIHLP